MRQLPLLPITFNSATILKLQYYHNQKQFLTMNKNRTKGSEQFLFPHLHRIKLTQWKFMYGSFQHTEEHSIQTSIKMDKSGKERFSLKNLLNFSVA